MTQPQCLHKWNTLEVQERVDKVMEGGFLGNTAIFKKRVFIQRCANCGLITESSGTNNPDVFKYSTK